VPQLTKTTLSCGVRCSHAGKPKRHLLTTNWSSFMQRERLELDDRVVFVK